MFEKHGIISPDIIPRRFALNRREDKFFGESCDCSARAIHPSKSTLSELLYTDLLRESLKQGNKVQLLILTG